MTLRVNVMDFGGKKRQVSLAAFFFEINFGSSLISM